MCPRAQLACLWAGRKASAAQARVRYAIQMLRLTEINFSVGTTKNFSVGYGETDRKIVFPFFR